jgi:hypothetical protein
VTTRLFGCLFALVCGASLAAGFPAMAAGSVPSGRAEEIALDIPAQPLAAALYAYSAATAVAVVADGALVSGRQSAAIRGVFAPEDALKGLLTGTGLTVQHMAANSFVLVPAPIAETVKPPDPPRVVPNYASYSALIQTTTKRALCRFAATQPGSYRAVMQLWIASSGVVTKADLLSITGDHARDDMLSAILRGLIIGEPPPAGLPQPVTLIILPRSSAYTADCHPTGVQ